MDRDYQSQQFENEDVSGQDLQERGSCSTITEERSIVLSQKENQDEVRGNRESNQLGRRVLNQKSPFSITENCNQFIKEQEKSQTRKRKLHLNQSLSNSMCAANISLTYTSKNIFYLKQKYLKNSLNLRHRLYTPIMNRNHSHQQFLFPQNDLINQPTSQVDLGCQLIHENKEDSKIHKRSLQVDFNEVAEQSNNDIQNDMSLAITKNNDVQKINNGLFHGDLVYVQKTKYFYLWRQLNAIDDVSEQVELLENDLIIEKSKSTLMTVFSKLNTKFETLQKYQFLTRLIQNKSESPSNAVQCKKCQDIKQMSTRDEKINQLQLKLAMNIIKEKIAILIGKAFEKIRHFDNIDYSSLENTKSEFTSKEIPSVKSFKTQLVTNRIKINKNKLNIYSDGIENYYGLRNLQRMVLSGPTFPQIQTLKLIQQNKHNSVNITNNRNFKKTQNDKDLNIIQSQKDGVDQIELIIEEDEQSYIENQNYSVLLLNNSFIMNQQNNNHFTSTQAVLNNDSIIKISPEKDSKRASLNPKLNISNILKNNNNTEIMDEEDHHILTRLMQKYQRDFNHLQGNHLQVPNAGHNSNTTLNLNSQDTLAHHHHMDIIKDIHSNSNMSSAQQKAEILKQQIISANSLPIHKRQKSMLYYDKNNFFDENKKEEQQRFLQNKSRRTLPKHLVIEENYEGKNNNILDDKLSFTSPTSIGILNINGRKRISEVFNADQKDENNSISVSNIEDVDLPNQSQTRIEIQELRQNNADNSDNDDDDQKRNDFSFSMEKEKGQYLFSGNHYGHRNRKNKKNKKEGSSRNQISKEIVMSKQQRENQALNELNNVLNQQCNSNMKAGQYNLRSSDLIYCGSTQGAYNHLLEQETANFKGGDWHNRSPLANNGQPNNIATRCSRGSINGGRQSILSQNHLNFNNEINLQCQNEIQQQENQGQTGYLQNRQILSELEICSPTSKEAKPYLQQSCNSLNQEKQYNMNDLTYQEGNSPIQMHSHYANFSSEFISPDRCNKSINYQKNQNKISNGHTINNSQFLKTPKNNTSILLNVSGANTPAQQSAFENFRAKISDTLNMSTKIQKEQIGYQQPSQIKRYSQKVSPAIRKGKNYTCKSVFDEIYHSQQQLPKKSDMIDQQNLIQPLLQNDQHNINTKELVLAHLNFNSDQVQDQLDQHLQNLIREEILQRQSVAYLGMADPMEIGSAYDSIAKMDDFQYLQTAHLNQSIQQEEILSQQNIDIKENENNQTKTYQELIKQQPYIQNLKQVEKNSSSDLKQINENSLQNIPLLEFNLANFENTLSKDTLRINSQYETEIFNKENKDMLQPQICKDNHFQKRTMSFNDIKQLGKSSQSIRQLEEHKKSLVNNKVFKELSNNKRGGFMTQRSMSISQFEESKDKKANNEIKSNQKQLSHSKYIDAFKQYEADKIVTKNITKGHNFSKINNRTSSLKSLNASNTLNNDKFGQSQISSQYQNQFNLFKQNFKNTYSNVDNQTQHLITSGIDQKPYFVVDDQMNNVSSILGANTTLEVAQGELNSTSNVYMDEKAIKMKDGIKEQSAEEEESFIFVDDFAVQDRKQNDHENQEIDNNVEQFGVVGEKGDILEEFQQNAPYSQRISVDLRQYDDFQTYQDLVQDENQNSQVPAQNTQNNEIKDTTRDMSNNFGKEIMSPNNKAILECDKQESSSLNQKKKSISSINKRQPKEIMIQLDLLCPNNPSIFSQSSQYQLSTKENNYNLPLKGSSTQNKLPLNNQRAMNEIKSPNSFRGIVPTQNKPSTTNLNQKLKNEAKKLLENNMKNLNKQSFSQQSQNPKQMTTNFQKQANLRNKSKVNNNNASQLATVRCGSNSNISLLNSTPHILANTSSNSNIQNKNFVAPNSIISPTGSQKSAINMPRKAFI